MSWHKTNLALILVLILIDVFLAFTVYDAYKETKIMPDDLIIEARENLKDSGITFDDSAIDKKYRTKNVYKYTTRMTFAEEMKENAQETHPCLLNALAFLDSKERTELKNSVSYFDVPGATSISVLDSSGAPKASASITGMTEFEYSENGFSSLVTITKIREKLSEAYTVSENINTPKIVSDFFRQVYDDKIGAVCTSVDELDGGTLYTCYLSVDGDVINGMPVCFFVRNDKIVYLKGHLFFSVPQVEYNSKIIDSVNILYSLREYTDKNVTVEAQHHEYSTVTLENDGVYIYPVWKLECRIAEFGEYPVYPLFNALTGEYLQNAG